MPTVQLLFTRRHHPGSVVIRTTTWSAWSHVDLVDGDRVIGAVATGGVVEEALSIRLADASHAKLVDVPSSDPAAVLAAARSQLGKPYDWLGVLGIGLRRKWQDTDRWFCSELVAWAFQQSGQPLFRPDALYRITPQHLWMLPNPESAAALIAITRSA